MAIMEPELIPAGRDHIEAEERGRLMRFELLVAQGKHEGAQEEAESLWLEANDAHKRLYQGLSNALTAVCAREAGQRRGSREIAQRTRHMLAPYPRQVIGLDLDALLESVDEFVLRGEGPILLLRQGG